MVSSDPRPAARSLVDSGDLSIEDLWLQYKARGGNADVLELDAFIHDVPLLHGLEVEILDVTLNELRPIRPLTGKHRNKVHPEQRLPFACRLDVRHFKWHH